MKKCLSFVGTGSLNPARYIYQNQEYDTCIIQEALTRFYPTDLMILFITDQAEKINLTRVLDALTGFQVKVVKIPDGSSERQLWNIFRIISQEVEPDDEILFDITHAFRYLPFLAFLSATYIREVTGAGLSGVVYGAYEAGEDITGTADTPIRKTAIFDLTPFISLIDWMMAVRSFVSFGDARGIRGLISSTVDDLSTRNDDPALAGMSLTHLTRMADPLHQFTAAVQLARPVEGINAAEKIMQALPGARDEIEHLIPALGPVLNQISDLERFALKQQDSLSEEHLIRQTEIIRYQVEKGLYLQAAELSREWLVSMIIYAMGDGNLWLDEGVRSAAEKALNDLVRRKNHQTVPVTRYGKKLQQYPDWKDIAFTWSIIAPMRNDLAHCGMRDAPYDAGELERRVRTIPEKIATCYSILCRKKEEKISDPPGKPDDKTDPAHLKRPVSD